MNPGGMSALLRIQIPEVLKAREELEKYLSEARILIESVTHMEDTERVSSICSVWVGRPEKEV